MTLTDQISPKFVKYLHKALLLVYLQLLVPGSLADLVVKEKDITDLPPARIQRFWSEIDLDQSGEIEPQELANFLRLFRRPILTDAARALAGFFRLCGFAEEYREAVDAMLELAIKRCITVFVDHAFKSSDENVDFLMSLDEFKVWCRLNTNVTSWVAQLSSFVLNQLQIRKLITVAELS